MTLNRLLLRTRQFGIPNGFAVAIVMIVWLSGNTASAQLADEFNPPRSNCCLLNTARGLADQLQDWNQLGRYHQANQQLKQQPVPKGRVVFMGDSITDFWNLAESFPAKPYVNRGISGQTTSQMLVRMYPDVLDLKPAAVVLLAGINDVSRNTGPSTAEMIEQNIMAMTELAQHHGIKVILCSLLPVSDYPYLKQNAATDSSSAGARGAAPPRIKMTEGHPPADILKLNGWIKDYAARVNATYVDYLSAFVDEKGWLKDAYSADGLHPNAAGYTVMNGVLAAALQKALP
jgi:lysophospholipase L1-like esterase